MAGTGSAETRGAPGRCFSDVSTACGGDTFDGHGDVLGLVSVGATGAAAAATGSAAAAADAGAVPAAKTVQVKSKAAIVGRDKAGCTAQC